MQSKKDLVAELRALRQENADLRRQLRLLGQTYSVDADMDGEAATEAELELAANKLIKSATALSESLASLSDTPPAPIFLLARQLASHIRAKEEGQGQTVQRYGRPPKYTDTDALTIYRQHCQGATIRALASEKGMSTTTIQKLLRRAIELGGQ